MNLKVFLAGRVAIESERGVIEEDRFPGRQGRLLFAYLVAEQGRPVPRDELADALWGEAPPATANKALGVLASKLRGLLADAGIDGGEALTSAFGSYRLNLPDGSWVDIVAAADGLRDAEAALATDDFDQARKLGLEAASLARASFLPGEEGAWVDGKRRELTDIHRRALSCLAEASLRSGDEAEAASWAEETIALDPYRETGYRQLMAAHAAAGNRAEALRVYERCRQLLATELGAYPSPETESIYRELLEAPATGASAAAPETAPVAVAEREPQRAETPPARAVPRSLSRRRRVVIGALAGVLAAVAIPFLALGGGDEQAKLDDGTNKVGLLDEGSGKVIDGIDLEDAAPTAVAVGYDYVWAASADSDAVFAIDQETNTVRQKIPVEGAPGGIAVGGGYVWVTNSLTGKVSQIDPEAKVVIQSIPVGNGPTGIDVGNGYVWVANTFDHAVAKIRASTGKLVRTYRVVTDPGAVAVGLGAVWVTSKSTNTLFKLNPVNGHVLDQIAVGQAPSAVAVGLGSVWVANGEDGNVMRIDRVSDKMIEATPVGDGPSGIAIADGKVWTANDDGTVSRIDPAERLTKTTDLGNRPSALAAGNGPVYVALRPTGNAHRGGTLTVAMSLQPLATLDLAAGALSTLFWGFVPLTNDGLLTYRHVGGQAGNQLVPDLALSMPTTSADRKTFTFHLRPNIRYSNGRLVRASDFRYAIERVFKLRLRTEDVYARDAFRAIRGADRCHKNRCNLKAGIYTDNVHGTIEFHLSVPDPHFLQKLTFSTAAAVPAGTSLEEQTRRPLPATGPYRIASATGDSVHLMRNPYFQEWEATAQPDGFPDEIVLKGMPMQKAIALVEHEKADLASNIPLQPFSIEPRFQPRKHEHPSPTDLYLALDTHRPPFDDPRARRALNVAIDRNKLAKFASGGVPSQPTCQVLPPNFPGYRRYCPYAVNLNEADRLVAASGTHGAPVPIWVNSEPVVVRIGRYLSIVLKRLGYRPQLRTFNHAGRYFRALESGVMLRERGPRVAVGGWSADFPAASSFIQELFSCRSKFNYARFCDQTLEQSISRATKLEQSDPQEASRLWTQLDRDITNKALWVPLFNPSDAYLVSKRVGNYQYSPRFGPLLSQLWVR